MKNMSSTLHNLIYNSLCALAQTLSTTLSIFSKNNMLTSMTNTVMNATSDHSSNARILPHRIYKVFILIIPHFGIDGNIDKKTSKFHEYQNVTLLLLSYLFKSSSSITPLALCILTSLIHSQEIIFMHSSPPLTSMKKASLCQIKLAAQIF